MSDYRECESRWDCDETSRKLSELQESTSWQPIATAPKDDARVLVYVPGEGIGVAEYDGGDWLCAWGDYEWVDRGAEEVCLKTVRPTHWMRLPGAPVPVRKEHAA